MFILYNRRYETLQTYDQACIDYLEGLGYTVVSRMDSEIANYYSVHYASILLIIVAAPGTDYVATHVGSAFLQTVECPVITFCRGTGRVIFGMSTGSTTFSWSEAKIGTTPHPIHAGLPTDPFLMNTTTVTTQQISTLTSGTSSVIQRASGTSLSPGGVAERFATINSVDYSRIFFGWHRFDVLTDNGKLLFSNILDYFQLPMAKVSIEGLEPYIWTHIKPPSAEIELTTPAPGFVAQDHLYNKNVVLLYGNDNYIDTHHTELVNILNSKGANVVLVEDIDIMNYDFGTTDLVIVGDYGIYYSAPVSQSTLIFEIENKLSVLEIPILTFSTYAAMYMLKMSASSASISSATINVTDPNHYIMRGYSSGNLTLWSSSVSSQGLLTLSGNCSAIAYRGGATDRAIIVQQNAVKDHIIHKRMFWGWFRFATLNSTGRTIFKRALSYLLQPESYGAYSIVEGLPPTIRVNNATVTAPPKSMNIVYILSSSTDEIDEYTINKFTEFGHNVTFIPASSAPTYDYKNVDLVVVGGVSSYSSGSHGRVGYIPKPILFFNRAVAAVYGGMASSQTFYSAQYAIISEESHPLIDWLEGSQLDMGGLVTTSALSTAGYNVMFLLTHLTANTRGYLAAYNRTIDGSTYPWVFFGRRYQVYDSVEMEKLFVKTVGYLLDQEIALPEVYVEGLPPLIRTKWTIPIDATADTEIEGYSPIVVTNCYTSRPPSASLEVDGVVPSNISTTRHDAIRAFLTPPFDISNYCDFSVGSGASDDWIESIHIVNQDSEVLLDVGPYTYHPTGHRDNTDMIIKCYPGDVLTIAVTVNAGSTSWDQALSWGHTIYSEDLVTVADLHVADGCPWTHTYNWTVPTVNGTFLVAWWEIYSGYGTGCGTKSYAERHSYALQIGDPEPATTAHPYYMFMGDVGTDMYFKTLMPMLGGFVNVETFKLEKTDRLASGRLVSDVSSTKKRITVTFENMLVEDYEKWRSEQSLSAPREIHLLSRHRDMDESYTVDFLGEYGHLKLKTDRQWVYGQVTFVLEEI